MDEEAGDLQLGRQVSQADPRQCVALMRNGARGRYVRHEQLPEEASTRPAGLPVSPGVSDLRRAPPNRDKHRSHRDRIALAVRHHGQHHACTRVGRHLTGTFTGRTLLGSQTGRPRSAAHRTDTRGLVRLNIRTKHDARLGHRSERKPLPADGRMARRGSKPECTSVAGAVSAGRVGWHTRWRRRNCLILKGWAASSVGRAPRSQRGGRGFESHAVHQPLLCRS